MKQWIALLFCVLLLVTAVCPVWAEETEPTDTTSTTTVIGTTEPSGEITEPSESESETTTALVGRPVFLTITYENKAVVVRAKDANGQPVRRAPVSLTADGQTFSGQTNDGGMASFPMDEEPAQVNCSTEAFKGSIFHYEAASASVTFHAVTEPTTMGNRTVSLTITYENQSIIIRVKDSVGLPVPNAPVKVAADREQLSGQTNESGVATFPMAEEPAQIICSTEAFAGDGIFYEGGSASVILHTPSSGTVSTTVESSTPPRPSTSYMTGTSVTWTTSNPLEGNVTVTEIITSSTVVEEDVDEEPIQTAPQKSPLPSGWALALMIMGGVLLVVAAVVLCLFLFRAPRLPVEETETVPEVEPVSEVPAELPVEDPVMAEEVAEVTEVLSETPDEIPAEPVGQTTVLSENNPQTVSLEDLFRDR